MAREFWIEITSYGDSTVFTKNPGAQKPVIHCREVIEGEITDTMRLDWLDKESVGILKTSFGEFIIARNGWRTSAKTPREAIDAAIKENKGEK